MPSIRQLPLHRLGDLLLGHRPDPAKTPRPGNIIGIDPPPYENLPNRIGEDPHGAPRATPAEQQLVSDFFEGAIQESDNCGGGPCYAGGFTGP